jgi:hypothetical protein
LDRRDGIFPESWHLSAFFPGSIDDEAFQLEDMLVLWSVDEQHSIFGHDHPRVRQFLDRAIRNQPLTELDFEDQEEAQLENDPRDHITYEEINPDVVDNVIWMDVILENSPPEAIPLSAILKSRATTLTIGTFTALAARYTHDPMLFITIPTGILVVGAAVALADGMKEGLNFSIRHLMHGSSRAGVVKRPRKVNVRKNKKDVQE